MTGATTATLSTSVASSPVVATSLVGSTGNTVGFGKGRETTDEAFGFPNCTAFRAIHLRVLLGNPTQSFKA
jgi:hypothetical protein